MNGAMFAVFMVCGVVQYNDPDWIVWLLAYFGAACLCLGKHYGFLPRWSYWVFFLLALSGAMYWVLGVPSDTDLLGAFADVGSMTQHGSERIREVGGLTLIGTWMMVLALQPSTMEANISR